MFTRRCLACCPAIRLPFIDELTLYENNGSTHTYRFSEVHLNGPITAGQFEFKPPAGTEVLRPE